MSAKNLLVRRGKLIVRSLLLAGAFLTVIPHSLAASTWNVPSDFPTIQAAIDGAAAGDTIIVDAGFYHESLSWFDKDLTLQGAGTEWPVASIIDPSGGRADVACQPRT
jgi:pectin methylesterase-like acyl-CoA thioesterase